MATIVDNIVGVLASSKHIIVSSDITGNTNISSTHPLLTLKNNNSDSHGSLLRLQKDTKDEADNDFIGIIQFTANNNADNRIHYGSISCQQTSVNSGSETAKLIFSTSTSNTGANTEIMSIQGGSHITPIVDSQTIINGSLKARLYSGNDPYELTKVCNIDSAEQYGYTNHILDKNHQYDVTSVSGPFKISNPVIGNESQTGLTAGSGITDATGEVYKSWIDINNTTVKIYIFIDITGLRSNAANKIIGKDDGTANCHIGQIPSDVEIIDSKVRCIETPAGGSTDIDFYSSTVATGAEDYLITDLANDTLLLANGGAWAADMTRSFTMNIPTSGHYLYLVNGGSTVDATYTTGQFLIELTGRYKLTPGSGIDATNSNYYAWIEEKEDDKKVKTNIIIDITGLNSSIAGDIIGKNSGTANCHFGQINYSQTGIIYKSVITCIEAPTTGSTDIDIYCATESDAAEDNPITGETETLLYERGGVWAANDTRTFTTNPIDTNYLYLVNGGSDADATYATGKFLIELYGSKISHVPNITSIVPCYDADFGSAFKMYTGSTAGNYIELCSQDPSYVCAAGRKWWIETQFKIDDFDSSEFFFGIAEPPCGSEDLIFVSSTTFVKGAGKDRVGFTKLVHNTSTIEACSTHNATGGEQLPLDTAITYDTNNNILTLGIYWDGNSNVYFYGNVRTTGSSIVSTALLYTHIVGSTKVVPTDSNNYLRLFINNGGSSDLNSIVNYIRGKIEVTGSSSVYIY